MKLMMTLLAGAVLMTQPVFADDGGRGLEISKDRKTRDTGWGDSQANMTMILRNAQGEESKRKMRLKNFEILDDGDKGLTIFDEPKDVSGTTFLSFSHIETADDQWLYLPALRKVKRIATNSKEGPFLGTDFSFADIERMRLADYVYTLKEEKENISVIEAKTENGLENPRTGYSQSASK